MCLFLHKLFISLFISHVLCMLHAKNLKREFALRISGHNPFQLEWQAVLKMIKITLGIYVVLIDQKIVHCVHCSFQTLAIRLWWEWLAFSYLNSVYKQGIELGHTFISSNDKKSHQLNYYLERKPPRPNVNLKDEGQDQCCALHSTVALKEWRRSCIPRSALMENWLEQQHWGSFVRRGSNRLMRKRMSRFNDCIIGYPYSPLVR